MALLLGLQSYCTVVLFSTSLFLSLQIYPTLARRAERATTQQGAQRHGRCETLKIPFCENIGYNQTIMPNLLRDENQEAAGLKVHEFSLFASVNCNVHFKTFLCAMYAPVCTVLNHAIPPCRSLCTHSKAGCEELMQIFGVPWPEEFECSKFPERGLCVDSVNS